MKEIKEYGSDYQNLNLWGVEDTLSKKQEVGCGDAK